LGKFYALSFQILVLDFIPASWSFLLFLLFDLVGNFGQIMSLLSEISLLLLLFVLPFTFVFGLCLALNQ
jgi:hypothetical protein